MLREAAVDYEPLRVPEVWIYRAGRLCIYVFDGRHYREVSDSPTFPGLPLREWIPQQIRRAREAGSSVAVREFERAIREFPAPEQDRPSR